MKSLWIKRGFLFLFGFLLVSYPFHTSYANEGDVNDVKSTLKINRSHMAKKNGTSKAEVLDEIRGYTPFHIRKAYGLDQVKETGKGQHIAVVVAYGSPTIKKDLAVFSEKFSLPKAKLKIYYPEGKPTETNPRWVTETAMDVQWVHAIAPKAKISLVVAKDKEIPHLVKAIKLATALGANVVSNSWGSFEDEEAHKWDSTFSNKKVTYVASAGDYGKGILWPASARNVLAVGGTTLRMEQSGNFLSEVAWSGSSGGISAFTKRPAYQQLWAETLGDFRGVPDVSFVGDPMTGAAVYSSTEIQGYKGWFLLGGTSLSTPCWSGIVALINEKRAKPLSSEQLVKRLYALKDKGVYRDIVAGTNQEHSATVGYDLVTGLGSPIGASLIQELQK
ncbi:physarolisin II. Serine peptidase. MEROPS family S53 [Marininema mesophilum]|uniref:Physarolisin II. Serine peptidase. MEROPS family S53 n=1 Tax=Marininema mesophilum TaxID=1048340 RepID=A0A1H2WJF9_9BACL|nr:S53 family peptidase [Marininema mesophilum]SDW80762.1 physarolisin II. Serine peptidase. MEROPS family S53 [Marininema mesophilum]